MDLTHFYPWSLKEISSELTIRGRYEEETIDRCTCSDVDRYRREASTIEDYDRSISNKETHLLFSEDPAHLERSIHKDQRSTSLDAAAFTSTDSRTQPSTDTRPSSSIDPHRSTSIDTTPLTSIDPQSRNMVTIVILRQDENGNMYDQDGHLRNATGQKLDAQGNVIPDADATGAAQPVEEAAPPKALADNNRPDAYHANRSAIRLPELHELRRITMVSTDVNGCTSIDRPR
ncbi:hypothetical protein DY000_02039953 [Brassica cretica]|uniref:Uncharacterized protein n=1 Tax=Brassica cretica TaxID=69181 RepID=A0ABQ7B7D5_BRACR|nr:hypothetical protein DY000_02039953 [Brassica cretica]